MIGMKAILKQKKTKEVFQVIILIMIGASCTTAHLSTMELMKI